MSRIAALAALLLAQALAKRAVVFGGTGRVGASTAAHLKRLVPDLDVVVSARSDRGLRRASRRWPEVAAMDFVASDLGDGASLRAALRGCDLAVHCAGPFQGKVMPEVLDAALAEGVAYVDVCDETELCKLAKTEAWASRATEVPCVVSAGIWPGVSALMAKRGVARAADAGAAPRAVEYAFYTAGTGNAGPTIVSATFLLLVTPALCYEGGALVERDAWSDARDVPFRSLGGATRRCRLLDCPDAYTLGASVLGDFPDAPLSVSSRFSTEPELWNGLFGLSKRLVPDALLADRDAMQALALFSEPVVRAVDALVGSTNVMKVDVTDDRGVVRTLEHGHDDLETAVGLATAAFGKELLDGAVAPGIYWPSDLPPDVSDRICDVVREDAGTFLWEE